VTSEACRVAEGFRPFVTSPVYSCEHDEPGSINRSVTLQYLSTNVFVPKVSKMSDCE